MEKKTMYILGGVAAAAGVGLYLYTRKSAPASTTAPTAKPNTSTYKALPQTGIPKTAAPAYMPSTTAPPKTSPAPTRAGDGGLVGQTISSAGNLFDIAKKAAADAAGNTSKTPPDASSIPGLLSGIPGASDIASQVPSFGGAGLPPLSGTGLPSLGTASDTASDYLGDAVDYTKNALGGLLG